MLYWRKSIKTLIISVLWGLIITYTAFYVFISLKWLIPFLQSSTSNDTSKGIYFIVTNFAKKYVALGFLIVVVLPYVLSLVILNYLVKPAINRILLYAKIIGNEVIEFAQFEEKYIANSSPYAIYLRSFQTDMQANTIYRKKSKGDYTDLLDNKDFEIPFRPRKNKLEEYLRVFDQIVPVFVCKNILQKTEYLGIKEIRIPVNNWEAYMEKVILGAKVILIHIHYFVTEGFIIELEKLKLRNLQNKVIVIMNINKGDINYMPFNNLFNIELIKFFDKAHNGSKYFTIDNDSKISAFPFLESALGFYLQKR